MKKIKISILIPVFNGEKYINKCLNSIVNQTYDNLEILIVDDGSKDTTKQIIEDYCVKDSRIKYLYQENAGICSARNNLIKNFTGDYALFVDSDDTIEKDCCKELIDVINDNPELDLVVFDYKREFESEKYVNEFEDNGKIELFTSQEVLKKYIRNDKWFSMVLWRRLYKKNILKSVKFIDNLLPEDYHTAFYIYKTANKIAHISRSYYNYLIKSDGLTIRRNLSDYKKSYIVCTNVYSEECKYFKNKKDIKRINTIYFNRLLIMYANTYYSNLSKEREELLNVCTKSMLEISSNALELKTKLIYYVFKANKKIACDLIYKKNISNIKKR